MNRWTRIALVTGVAALHLVVLLTVTITTRAREEREDTSVFKLVDIQEFVPPVEALPEPEETPPPETPVVVDEPAEIILETEDDTPPQPVRQPETPIEFLPQHRISVPPDIPTDLIRSRIEYPALANRSGIEGVVYLELFIDSTGVIRKIEVLREPGYGLAEAAVAAFEGLTVAPAEANGVPVAVRYRYPVRFVLR